MQGWVSLAHSWLWNWPNKGDSKCFEASQQCTGNSQHTLEPFNTNSAHLVTIKLWLLLPECEVREIDTAQGSR